MQWITTVSHSASFLQYTYYLSFIIEVFAYCGKEWKVLTLTNSQKFHFHSLQYWVSPHRIWNNCISYLNLQFSYISGKFVAFYLKVLHIFLFYVVFLDALFFYIYCNSKVFFSYFQMVIMILYKTRYMLI